MTPSRETTGHAFISYVREDADRVKDIVSALKAADIPVWVDKSKLSPGEDWQLTIRKAIQRNALAFLAVFSGNSQARDKSYQHEELALAVEQFRQHPPGRVWLIPVRLDDCQLPDYQLGGGRTLNSLQRVDLFGDDAKDEVIRLVTAVLRVLGDVFADPAPHEASITQADQLSRSAVVSSARNPMLREPTRQRELNDVSVADTDRPDRDPVIKGVVPRSTRFSVYSDSAAQLGGRRMAEQVESTIEVVDSTGVSHFWIFDLDLNAPLDPDTLKPALVAAFGAGAEDASDFDLSIAGTFEKPLFKLSARLGSFIGGARPRDRRS